MGIDELVRDLEAALHILDRKRAEGLAGELMREVGRKAGKLSADQARRIAKRTLGELRKKRCFRLVEEVAGSLIECGRAHPAVQRQLVQALIDQGKLAEARVRPLRTRGAEILSEGAR